jgi:hypothetical protein
LVSAPSRAWRTKKIRRHLARLFLIVALEEIMLLGGYTPI